MKQTQLWLARKVILKWKPLVSGCGSVGRAVTSYTRDPQFKSSHRQILFTFMCIKKHTEKIKEAENRPI